MALIRDSYLNMEHLNSIGTFNFKFENASTEVPLTDKCIKKMHEYLPISEMKEL